MYDDIDNEEIAGLPKSDPNDRFKDRLPRGYLSVSQVTQYMRCGEAYYQKYVLERSSPATYYQVQGRGVHKAAEKLHLHIIDQSSISAEEMVAVYSDLYDEEIKEVDFNILSDEDPGEIKDAGVTLTKKYHKVAMGEEPDPTTGLFIPAVKPIAAERVIHTEIVTPDGEKLPFMGVIDLEEEFAIADLKTKKKAASQNEADNSLQLSLYAHIGKKPIVRLDQLIKPTKRLPARYLRTESSRTVNEIAHALEVVSEVADDIARGRFRKTNPENWWCTVTWCPYWFECRGKQRK
jgi:hypothetical protein